MTKHQVYIGLGSNLDRPVNQIREAIIKLKSVEGTTDFKCSDFYKSKPLAEMKQPDYCNAVVSFKTPMDALILLDRLQAIENEQGRIRKKRWQARTLDLDLLLFDNDIIEHPRLIVPHYGLKERNFVIYPLHDINPELILPDGTTLKELYNNCSPNGIIKIE